MSTEKKQTEEANDVRANLRQRLIDLSQFLNDKEHELRDYRQEVTDGGSTPSEIHHRFDLIRGKKGQLRAGQPDSVAALTDYLDIEPLSFWVSGVIDDFNKNVEKMYKEANDYVKEYKENHPHEGGDGYTSAFIPK